MIGIFLALIDTEEDKAKFIALYEQYRKLMFYVANEILKDESLSEDAVQEAFLRIAKNFHKIGEISCHQTKSFVVIIVRNISLNILSKEKASSELNEDISYELHSNIDDTFENVSYNLLVDSILALPAIYRDVLYMHHIYGYSYPEISGLLGITLDTVKKRAERGKGKLKHFIETEGGKYHG